VTEDTDPANGGIRQEPEVPAHEDVVARPAPPRNEFEFDAGEEDAAAAGRQLQKRFQKVARQASIDRDDGLKM
jgi:type IV secretion system protein VirD4